MNGKQQVKKMIWDKIQKGEQVSESTIRVMFTKRINYPYRQISIDLDPKKLILDLAIMEDQNKPR